MQSILILLTVAVLPMSAAKPNIVVIMADDMGYADAGFSGATDIKTPNLDKIAASGVIFRQGYASHPFCGPSRAAFLTGRYPHRFGFETNPAYDPANPIMGIPTSERLFPARLQKAGYTTACVGKWHLGAAKAFHPNKRGFDYFYGGHDYFRIDLTEAVREGYLQGLVRNKAPADFQGYLTTALSRDAANWVTANADKPFFLFLSYNAPHMPLQAPADDIARYAHIPDKKRRVYAAMVDVMDRGIGEVVTALEKSGVRDNTLIFFLSDNGGPQSSEQHPGNWNGSSNGPFRGGKGRLYEGGVHVPFILSWPAKIAAGQTFDAPVCALDIARTAVAVAGANAAAKRAMEGVDLIPFVTRAKSAAPHDALFWRNGRHWSVLAADGTKYVQDIQNPKPQLFYLPDDIAESKDLAEAQPERAKTLRATYSAWDADNVACRLLGYTDYHKKRDAFFKQAIPSAAAKEGYEPDIKETFR
jgi:arylsulfatase A-like enzyme